MDNGWWWLLQCDQHRNSTWLRNIMQNNKSIISFVSAKSAHQRNIVRKGWYWELILKQAVAVYIIHSFAVLPLAVVFRKTYDIELRCFHQQNPDMTPSWPENIKITINSRPLHVHKMTPPDRDRTALIKEACRPGINCLRINISSCCCVGFNGLLLMCICTSVLCTAYSLQSAYNQWEC